ncbi:MmgE/PrpD family protein [Rhizobium leguminosarum]|uniref:MmgE/PrpD family protein n=1 Tax=Rhizobium leguminosarum TaxID=384 RepID=UPI001C953DE5|nr:MmgE/PrpD family protein [Rhizobium leguminosarum]MBY5377284.1 MmgE/PrpD family protein [Rhizobium leguminosarum]
MLQPDDATSVYEPVGATQALARFVAQTQVLPEAVEHSARRCFTNILANMVAGSTDPEIATMLSANSAFIGAPTATILGIPRKVDPGTAAVLNSASGNILDFDDTHPSTLIHPSAPILAAVLPIAESGNATISDVLLAFALGNEVAVRVGLALGREHYANGWHITATCGTIGAAAGAAKMLGLDENGIRNAIGIACTQAGGIACNFGSMAKSVGVGDAARSGLHAAFYARAGIDASPKALEGSKGYLEVTAPNPDPDAVTRDLGEVWESASTAPKPYPACVFLHPVLDAVFELRTDAQAHTEVDRVVVTGHPLLLAVTDRALPANAHEAKLSLKHSVAVAWTTGAAGLAQYSNAAVNIPSVRALAARVEAIGDPSIPTEAAHVRIEFADGNVCETFVLAARGSERRPLTDDELLLKSSNLVALRSEDFPFDAFISLCWSGKSHADLLQLLDMGGCRAT